MEPVYDRITARLRALEAFRLQHNELVEALREANQALAEAQEWVRELEARR